jgi:hypothetical protein
VTGMAYEMRLVLQGIYLCKDVEGAGSGSGTGAPGCMPCGCKSGVARTDGPSYPDDRRALGRNPGLLDPRADDYLNGWNQQPVLGYEAEGPRIPGGGIHDHHALLRHRETGPTVPLTH